MKKPVVAICSSANFYQKAVAVQAELEKAGLQAIVPHTAELMKESGNFEAADYRTWLRDPTKYERKTWLMREHFKEIETSDIVLVVNEEKHGTLGYIGGNVLIEMALGFYLQKPIYVLNELPSQSNFMEEIIAMQPVVLEGKLDQLISDAKK